MLLRAQIAHWQVGDQSFSPAALIPHTPCRLLQGSPETKQLHDRGASTHMVVSVSLTLCAIHASHAICLQCLCLSVGKESRLASVIESRRDACDIDDLSFWTQKQRLACMQKGGRPQGVNAQQHARNLQQQASAGAPGPGTPRATGPSIHSNRGDLVQGNSFDLGSFLAH